MVKCSNVGSSLIFLLTLLILSPTPSRADSGIASVYWEGSRTANGERFVPEGLTAAHRTLRFGTRLKVTYRNRTVTVRVNDRGPFIKGRVLDLSRGAAREIGCSGLCKVTWEVL